MPVSPVVAFARRLALALALGAATVPALAVPAMELRIEDLLPMAADFKKELKLNPNQETLWQQVETKTRQLVRERQGRRERLQVALKRSLAMPQAELRELAGGLDAEAAGNLAEQRQLREWWLTVNDALDETQRQAVAAFLGGQMERVLDAAPARGPERARGEGDGERGRGGRQKPGGGGINIGMPGA